MKIALIGTRGVPANYGGFETCAEEIAVGLVKKGHDVTAYCRHGNAPGEPAEFKGVKLVYCGHRESKSFGTLSHTRNSLKHAMKQGFDVLMVFNAANSPLLLLPKWRGHKIALNVDGLEWKRAKWPWYGKLYYRMAEWVATKASHRIISDSRAIQQYYEDKFKEPTTFIAYGGNIETSERPEILAEYGLEKDSYFFTASRLEPENNAHYTVRAFEKLDTDKKLVIAGGANWDSWFIKDLKKTTDPRIKFLGPVYKPGHIKELHCGAYAYVHGNEVGGTNPALLKAMGYGNCVLALDVNFNAEVLAGSGILWKKDVEHLRSQLRYAVEHPEVVAECRKKAVARIRDAYQWDRITDDYERLFERIVSGYYRQHPEND